MKCVIKLKASFLLVLFFFSLLPVFSQDSLSEKDRIINRLLNIRIQLINSQNQIRSYESQITDLEILILNSQTELTNSQEILNSSEKVITDLRETLEKQMELLAISERELRKQKAISQELSENLTSLSKRLKTLETQNNILLGIGITLGAATIVETLILIFR